MRARHLGPRTASSPNPIQHTICSSTNRIFLCAPKGWYYSERTAINIQNDIKLPNKVTIAWTLYHLDGEYDGFTSNIVQSLRKDPNSYDFNTFKSSLLDEARSKEGGDKVLYSAALKKGLNNKTNKTDISSKKKEEK